MDQHMKFLGECTISIRWCDLDNYGHVNNARYFEYMTEGRVKALDGVITPYDKIQYLLVDTSCNFKIPINYPCDLKIKHYIKAIGNKSFTIFCEMLSQDETVAYAHGEAKMVCFDATTQASVLIPDYLLKAFSG